jgi:hypothetical protein
MLYKRLMALLILALLVLSACGEDEKPSIQGSSANSQRTSASSTPNPYDVIQPTPDITDNLPTETTQPTPPPTSAVINVANADQLTEKFEAGKATLDDFVWSPDNEHLLAITSSGIRRYDSNDLETPPVEFAERMVRAAIPALDGLHENAGIQAAGRDIDRL